MIDLESFQPREHPFKAIFQKHRIRQAVLANYLKCSLSLLSHYLCGVTPMPNHVEEKLKALVDQLESDSKRAS